MSSTERDGGGGREVAPGGGSPFPGRDPGGRLEVRAGRFRPAGEVRLVRGGRVESVHRVHAVLADAEGRVLASWGEWGREVFLRSAAKPFQALPLVEDALVRGVALGEGGGRGAAGGEGRPGSEDPLPGRPGGGLTRRELALACGSHGGEPGHVAGVEALLARLGVGEESLVCGPHLPMHEESARGLLLAGRLPSRVHNNCSGKHAAMVALALHHGWPVEGYERRDHPVQERMAREVSRWTGIPVSRLGEGIDGCGVVCFSTPLLALARGYAAFLAAARTGEAGPATVAGAMGSFPFEVAGSGRACTLLMEEGGGRVLAKVGAEGVHAMAFELEDGAPVGLALKVEDGAVRAGEVAAVTLLQALAPPGTVGPGGRALLRKEVPNTRGEAAAFLEGDFGGEASRDRGERTGGRGGGGVPLPEATGKAHLPPGLRALARMVAAQGARDRPGLEREMGSVVLAVRRGELSGQKVEEALLQSYLFLGYPAALEALALWRQVGSAQVEGVVNERPGSWEVRGPRVLARVYGAQEAGLRRNIAALHPDMARWMVLEGYGKVLGRPGLPLREREILVAVLLAVQDAPRQLHSHLRGALRAGASPHAVDEALAEAAPWLRDPELRHRVVGRWQEVWERWNREESSSPDSNEPEADDVH